MLGSQVLGSSEGFSGLAGVSAEQAVPAVKQAVAGIHAIIAKIPSGQWGDFEGLSGVKEAQLRGLCQQLRACSTETREASLGRARARFLLAWAKNSNIQFTLAEFPDQLRAIHLALEDHMKALGIDVEELNQSGEGARVVKLLKEDLAGFPDLPNLMRDYLFYAKQGYLRE